MRVDDFANFLELYGNLLKANGALECARDWSSLVACLRNEPTVSVRDFCDAIDRIESVERGEDVKRLWLSLTHLEFLMEGQAKKSLLNDLTALGESLAAHKDRSLYAMLDATTPALEAVMAKPKRRSAVVREDVVSIYVENLQRTLGDEDAFVAFFDLLKADEQLNFSEVKKIAKLVCGKAVKSRRQALETIWDRHVAKKIDAEGEVEGTEGRTAA